ncbi:MAG: corrinoid protein [Bacillota bacterium]
MDSTKLFEEAASAIVDADKARAEDIARKALEMGLDPFEVINKGFIVGIMTVGDLFDRGDLFLPQLILCSEAMKSASEILNAAAGTEKTSSGKVIVATVEGDIHDIGKGIVVSLLAAHGLEVFDLGRDVPTAKIIEKAEELKVDIIGTSALLTTTMEKQKHLEEALRKEGLRDKYKTIVGGAPVTERWAKKIGADAYAEDATDGVKKVFDLLR